MLTACKPEENGSTIPDLRSEYKFPEITVYPDEAIVECTGYWFIYKMVNNSGGKIAVVVDSKEFPASIVLQDGEYFEWARWWTASVWGEPEDPEEEYNSWPFPERNEMKIYFNDKRVKTFRREPKEDVDDPRRKDNYVKYNCEYSGKNACFSGARQFVFTEKYFR